MSSKEQYNPKMTASDRLCFQSAFTRNGRGLVDAIRARSVGEMPLWSVRDGFDRGILHTAAVSGSGEPVRALMGLGVPDNVLGMRDKDGNTPLFLAVESRNADGLQALIAMGSNVNVTDDRGWTSLHHAAQTSDASMVAILLAAGADVGAVAPDGITPMHAALTAWVVNAEAVEMLRSAAEARALSSSVGGQAGSAPGKSV